MCIWSCREEMEVRVSLNFWSGNMAFGFLPSLMVVWDQTLAGIQPSELPLSILVFFFFWFVLEWLSLFRNLNYIQFSDLKTKRKKKKNYWLWVHCLSLWWWQIFLLVCIGTIIPLLKPKLYSILRFENEKEKKKKIPVMGTLPVSLMVADVSLSMWL